MAAFNQWKTDTVTTNGAGGFRRVQRPAEPGLEANSTVSEGIAYGMLIAVYMGDQALFDGLWKYEQTQAERQRVDGLVHQRRRDDARSERARPPTPTRTWPGRW